jgi:hypothetical protein
MLRYFTAGESHGEALVAFLSGLPAGLKVDQAFLDRELVAPPARLWPRRADEDRADKPTSFRACGMGHDHRVADCDSAGK